MLPTLLGAESELKLIVLVISRDHPIDGWGDQELARLGLV